MMDTDLSDRNKWLIPLGAALLLLNVSVCKPTKAESKPDKKMSSPVSAGYVCIETRLETKYRNVTVYYPCLQEYNDTCGFLYTSTCTKFRPANCSRTEWRPVTINNTVHVCCSGWRRDDQFRCVIPVCKNGCQNGGKCVDRNGSPECECPEGYVLNPDGISCDRSSEITAKPITGHKAFTSDKRKVSSQTIYILVGIGVVLLVLLIISTIYLLVRRKERLAMEALLKDRVTLSTNDYGNPAFRRFSNDFTLDENHRQENGRFPHVAVRSTTETTINGENTANNRTDVPVHPSSLIISNNHTNSPSRISSNSVSVHPSSVSVPNGVSNQISRISNVSHESRTSDVSTGWTNPLFLSMREHEDNRPEMYAMIEEECYSGSNLSGIYTSIPECVQTLEGFDVGESNDYDSFTSDEFVDGAEYENDSVPPLEPPINIRSVYLHTPCQSMQSASTTPIQEENDYEYVSDTCDKNNAIEELEYDYVANDDDMFTNRECSASSHLGTKANTMDDTYEDTDSPNTTLESAAEEQPNESNATYNYVTDEYPHEYDYAVNPSTNEYYEDGTSIGMQLKDLPEYYDYVSNENAGQPPNEYDNKTITSGRQSSVEEEYNGPTTYYDKATLLAINDDFDMYPGFPGEFPEYEYVRNSNLTEGSHVSEKTNIAENVSDTSNHSLPDLNETNRLSKVSYASIDGSGSELSVKEHDYDEISKKTVANLSTDDEEEYDSDYERVNDVVDKKNKSKVLSPNEQSKEKQPKKCDVKYQKFGVDKGNVVVIVDSEPVYDEVCPPDTESHENLGR